MNTAPIALMLDRALAVIRSRFYAALADRIWFRDRTELYRALARYGYECQKRGWELSVTDISNDLISLLQRMTPPNHQYFPKYLEMCVDRHVRMRAEEISAKSKKNLIPNVLVKIHEAVIPGETLVHEPTTVEILSDFYKAQNSIVRQRQHKHFRAQADKAQMKLL